MSPTMLRSAALAILPIGLAVGVLAQDKAKKSSHERLQPYWNQLELTDEQRNQYDRVVREYGPKIDRLEAELDALKDKRRKDWMSILSPAQARKLESLQASRGKKKAADKDDVDPAAKPKRGSKKPVDESTEDSKSATPTKRKKDVTDETTEESKPTKKKPKKDG